MNALPAGYRLRSPTLDDTPAIHNLLAAHDVAVIGFPDVTEDDVRDQFGEPGYDPATDGWLAIAGDGTAVGYAWVVCQGSAASIDIEVAVHPAADFALAAYLLSRVERRAAEVGAAMGHGMVTVAKGAYRAAAQEAALLAARGYMVATTFSRMAIALNDSAVPALPAGVDVVVCGTDDGLRRAAHAVKEEAFVDHFGTVARTYEGWLAYHDGRSVTDWSQVWLARLDGRPAGMVLANNAFVDTDNAGYVQTLAVLPSARGRGLAKLLLRTAFAELRRRGRDQALLGVDTGNTTGALALYESLGMRPTLQIDIWHRDLPTSC